MAATRDEVNQWIRIARENGDNFIISVCDTFDYEDYPVYCRDAKEVREKSPRFDGVNMQKINEIIRVPRKKPAIEGLSVYDFSEMF